MDLVVFFSVARWWWLRLLGHRDKYVTWLLSRSHEVTWIWTWSVNTVGRLSEFQRLWCYVMVLRTSFFWPRDFVERSIYMKSFRIFFGGSWPCVGYYVWVLRNEYYVTGIRRLHHNMQNWHNASEELLPDSYLISSLFNCVGGSHGRGGGA